MPEDFGPSGLTLGFGLLETCSNRISNDPTANAQALETTNAQALETANEEMEVRNEILGADDVCHEMAGYIISSPPPLLSEIGADRIDGSHFITLGFPVEVFLDKYMWHRDEHFHTNGYCTYDCKLRTIIKYGLVAALNLVFQVNGNHFPRIMKQWHEFVRLYLEERFQAQACRYIDNEHIVVTCSDTHINVCFYPNGAASPSLIDWSDCRFLRNFTAFYQRIQHQNRING